MGLQWQGMESPLRADYIREQLRRSERALAGMEQGGREEETSRRDSLRELVIQLKELLEEWEAWQR